MSRNGNSRREFVNETGRGLEQQHDDQMEKVAGGGGTSYTERIQQICQNINEGRRIKRKAGERYWEGLAAKTSSEANAAAAGGGIIMIRWE